MRPDRIPVAPRSTPRAALTITARRSAGARLARRGYGRELAALFSHSPRLPLDDLTSRNTLLADAHQAGHVRLEGEELTLTPEGARQIPPGPAIRRAGTTWRGDPLFAYAPPTQPGTIWQAPSYPGMARVVACDASLAGEGVGLGALAEDGRWAMCAYRHRWLGEPNLEGTVMQEAEDSTTLELRALVLAVALLPRGERGLVLTDSLGAVETVRRWRRGHEPKGAPPAGSDRVGASDLFGTRLALVALCRFLAAHPGVEVEHVRGHAGHALNEGADSLALMGRRSVETQAPGRHWATGEALGERAHAFATDVARTYRGR